MEYRIVDLARGEARAEEVGRFDSAYDAMEALREARYREPARARHWHLIDGAGRVLLRPDDVDDLAA